MTTERNEEPLCFAKRQAAKAQAGCSESVAATATQTITRVARENKDTD
ncbi:MAG: hypothetical protein ISS31_02240 [Kiritimatiellae bacterium]|nr:hypothetical protein [Kiritimatiellia bacterium]